MADIRYVKIKELLEEDGPRTCEIYDKRPDELYIILIEDSSEYAGRGVRRLCWKNTTLSWGYMKEFEDPRHPWETSIDIPLHVGLFIEARKALIKMGFKEKA